MNRLGPLKNFPSFDNCVQTKYEVIRKLQWGSQRAYMGNQIFTKIIRSEYFPQHRLLDNPHFVLYRHFYEMISGRAYVVKRVQYLKTQFGKSVKLVLHRLDDAGAVDTEDTHFSTYLPFMVNDYYSSNQQEIDTLRKICKEKKLGLMFIEDTVNNMSNMQFVSFEDKIDFWETTTSVAYTWHNAVYSSLYDWIKKKKCKLHSFYCLHPYYLSNNCNTRWLLLLWIKNIWLRRFKTLET